jgi:hypothetical protein
MPNPAVNSRPFYRNRILIGGLILYFCAFAILLRNKSFDSIGAVVVLIVFGIVFPLLAWIATRRAIPLSISITPGKSQLIVLIGYIIVLSVYLVGGPQWIDQHLPSSWIDSARTSFLSRSQRSLLFSSLFLSRSSDSVLVIGFAISEFNAKVYGRFAAVIYPLSLLWPALSLLSNIFSAVAVLPSGMDSLPLTNCSSVSRFASFGFSSKPD